ncbi:MAG: hypothetical protein AAGC55_01545 [Myxococcota bacterium]
MIGLAPESAWAQSALLEEDDDLGAPALTDERPAAGEPKANFGLGLRLRQVYIMNPILELFWGRAADTASQTGFGGEFIRRKGNFEFTIGLEYERLETEVDLWLERGDEAPMDEPDLVEFDSFGWVGIDFNFIWQAELSRMFALRYGAGLGVGLILGDVIKTDYRCPTEEVTLEGDNACQLSPMPEDERTVEEDIPPVFPIVNAIVGVQFRPIGNLAINLEGGIRTLLPFIGTSVAYTF